MSDLTRGDVAGMIQEVADSVEAMLDKAVFVGRIHDDDDGEAFPEHARYLLAIHDLTAAFGLTIERAAPAPTPPGTTQEEN